MLCTNTDALCINLKKKIEKDGRVLCFAVESEKVVMVMMMMMFQRVCG